MRGDDILLLDAERARGMAASSRGLVCMSLKQIPIDDQDVED